MSSLGWALTQDDWETCTDRHVQRKGAISQPRRGWHRCFPHIPNQEPTPQHLHFWFPASRTLRQCMLNYPFVVLCYSSPNTPIQMVFTFSSSGKHNQRMLFFNVKIVGTHISVNTITLTRFRIVSDCSCAAGAELSSCMRLYGPKYLLSSPLQKTFPVWE